MFTGVKIQSATYGVGSSTTDVTTAVNSHLVDGKLNFIVTPAALNIDDPSPGQIKTLTITYTINGGASNTSTAVDGEPIQIDGPPARVASGLQIKKAQYGYEGNYQDVTSAVRTYVNDGSINLTVGTGTMGIPDPNPRKVKYLKVDYTINGDPSSKTIRDGQKFVLNAPPVKTNTSQTPTDGALDIVGTITSDIFLFMKVFFVLSMTILAAKYGEKIFPGGYWVFGTLTLLTYGMFPILILPFLMLFWHLVMG